MLRRTILLPALTLTLLVLARLLPGGLTDPSAAASDSSAPRVEVDPFWPKPVPNNCLLVHASAAAADWHDHEGLIQRRKSLTGDERGRTSDRSRRGYGNHRVIVFDADTAAYKRHWGANGRPPGDTSVKGSGNPVHCVRLSRDGLLYVCDRKNNRIQVFRKDGTFVKEFVVAAQTRGNGSTWDVDLSPDGKQTVLYNADGENNHVWMLTRERGRILGTFGRNGRGPGQFHWIHNLAVDTKGNIYTTEVDTGKRAQKFVVR